MSPTNSGVATQLRNLIYYHLDNNNLRTALFCAGRLHALEPRAGEAAHLLALCHLRMGELKAAYDYSRSAGSRGTHLGCAYIFAQTCLALERYSEGITALEKSRTLWLVKNHWNQHTETRRQHAPDAPMVYCLLGKLYQAYEETHRAVDCYAAALKANPFMWDAFVGLCDLGVNVRIPNIFKVTPEMMAHGSTIAEESTTLPTIDDSPPLNVAHNPPTHNNHDPFNTMPAQQSRATKNGKVPLYEKLNGSHTSVTPISNAYDHGHDSFETPPNIGGAAGGSSKDTHVLDESAAPEPPQAPARKPRGGAGLNSDAAPGAPIRSRIGGLLSRPASTTAPEDNEGQSIPTWNPSGIADRKRTASGQVSKASIASTRNNIASSADVGAGVPARRSERLQNSIRPQTKYSDVGSIHKSMTAGKESGRELKRPKATGTRTTTARQTAGRVVSGNRRIGDPMDIDSKEARAIVPSGAPSQSSRSTQTERAKEQESMRQLLDLFTKLGSGYFALSHYRNQEAFTLLGSLPLPQRETPWVLSMMGRALFEQAKYVEAEKYFSRVRLLCPSRLDDVHIHSIVLWHLKHEVDLAHLAHEATDIDRLSPQAWCVVGNSFSLERNPEKALVALTRATQLDPTFAYGYTLQGHEHLNNEEYDKALAAYRSAMAADSRHYNAYYGIGKVLEKQGKYEEAERHYRIAASINPTNAVLISCIGGILEKLKQPQLALEQYTISAELAPKTVLSRFKKARLLMIMHQYEEALQELLILKDLAPDEANVHFVLGRCYRLLKMKGEAIKHFTAALNLDPKASHHIKEAMEEIEDQYDDDDEDLE